MKILDQLKSDIKCDEMQFWRKIIGAKKYYYISKALYYKGSPNFQKKYFFFQQFYIQRTPLRPDHHIDNFDKFSTYFIGNPDIILEKYDLEK